MTRRGPASQQSFEQETLRDTDRERLLRVLALYSPLDVPCRSGDLLPAQAWTSEHPEDLHLAAQACTYCPLQGPCRTYGTRWPTEEGVYGGLTPPQRHHAARTSTERP